MPKIAISDFSLRSLKPPERGQLDYWDERFPSFGIRLSQGGSKTFILNIHNSRRSIGRYPLISLAQARTEARRLLAEKTLGKVRPQSITFPQAVELFLEEKAKARRPSTVADLKDRLFRHFPLKGQLSEVTHQEIVRRLSKIKTPREHNHALRVGKGFFTWAMHRRDITENPCTGISTRTVSSRARVLSDQELQSIWRACDQTGGVKDTEAAEPSGPPRMPAHFATIVKLLIVTGQRRGEIAALQPSYFSHNQQTICLPATLTKNGREHTFPVSATAIELLKTAASETSSDTFLFPARGKKSKPFNGWSKSKVALDKLSGATSWTLHDLRRTFRSNLGRLGVAPHIAERYVNHISAQSEMEQTYDRWKYLPELRDAAERHDRFIASLLAL